MHAQLRDAMGQQPADIPVVLVRHCLFNRCAYGVSSTGQWHMTPGVWMKNYEDNNITAQQR